MLGEGVLSSFGKEVIYIISFFLLLFKTFFCSFYLSVGYHFAIYNLCFIFCRNEKNIFTSIALINKVFKRFACIVRIVTVNRNPSTIVYIFL